MSSSDPLRNDLTAPLGTAAPPHARPRLWRGAFASAVGLGLLAVFFALILDERSGGEPVAVATIQTMPPPPPTPAISPDVTGTIAPTGPDAGSVEKRSGVRVVRQNGGEAPGALIIEIPQAPSLRLPPAPDKRLVEKGRYGLLPRIGSDGARPADIYARPVMTTAKAGAPRIALVLTGLGLAANVTADAAEKLPAAVSFAFAPYGRDVERDVAAAREAGHEVLLQVPMEPFDAQNNPGPHTLLAGAEASRTADDLQWLMSRFTGYVGVANFLGAKFMSSEGALAPALRELSERGLFFLDDGSSPQSLTQTLAPGLGLSAARADVVLDVRPEALDAALFRLEAAARQNGLAIGVASALPATIDRLARFSKALEARGFALVPVSATVKSTGPVASRRAAGVP